MADKLFDITKSATEKWAGSINKWGLEIQDSSVINIIKDECSPTKTGEEGVLMYFTKTEYEKLKKDSNYNVVELNE